MKHARYKLSYYKKLHPYTSEVDEIYNVYKYQKLKYPQQSCSIVNLLYMISIKQTDVCTQHTMSNLVVLILPGSIGLPDIFHSMEI